MYSVAADDARRDAAVDSTLHILLIGGQKQIRLKGRQIGSQRSAADKHCSRNIETILLNCMEHPQGRIRAVAGHYDHFHLSFLPGYSIDIKQSLHKRKAGARL